MSIEQEAVSVHHWLQSLDPGIAPRAELRAAGVTVATVISLYPTTFEALTPALLAHLRTQDLTALQREYVEIESNRNTVEELLDHLPVDLAVRWESQWLAERDDPITSLVSEFYGLLGNDVDTAATLAETLWHTWWLMSHLTELPQIMHLSACTLMCWLNDNLLHAPVTAKLAVS